jgi:hypothetical protein
MTDCNILQRSRGATAVTLGPSFCFAITEKEGRISFWLQPNNHHKQCVRIPFEAASGSGRADISHCARHVRFTPDSGHVQCASACPLCADSGHPTIHLITVGVREY